MESSSSKNWKLNIPDEESLSPLSIDPEVKTLCFDFKLSIQSKKTLTFDDVQHTLLAFEQQYAGDTQLLTTYLSIMAKACEDLTEVSHLSYDVDSFCLVSFPIDSQPNIIETQKNYVFRVKHPDNPLIVSYKIAVTASEFRGDNYLQFVRPWLKRLFPKYYMKKST